MKKYQKILYITFAIINLFFIKQIVKADDVHSFYEGEWIPNIYINKVLPSGYKKYQQALVVRRKSDNHFAYCLEPFTDLKSDAKYIEINDNYLSNFFVSKKDWNRINLLAYYGYMYEGHEDIKWYAITQVLIWKTLNPSYDIYFTDTLNGKRKLGAYQSEINELEELVKKHTETFSFANQNIELNIGEKLALTDNNNRLDQFKITDTAIPASIENNTLMIEGTKVGDHTISLINTDSKYQNVPLLYTDDVSQNILITGSYEPIKVDLKVKINGIAIKLIKKDFDTKEIIKSENFKFKIKNISTDTFIENQNNKEDKYLFQTNKDGCFITANNLEYGEYAIIEEDSVSGYLKNQEPLIVKINENTSFTRDKNNNLVYEVSFYNQRVKGKIIVTKTGEIVDFKDNQFNYGFEKIADVSIGLYAKSDIKNINGDIIYPKNTLVAQAKTDSQGQVIFNDLYLGSYYVKELKTDNRYLLDEQEYNITLEATLDNTDEEITSQLALKNYLKKASIIINKTNSLTMEPIKDTEIGLFNINNELIYKTFTDADGKIEIMNIPLGTYYIEELNASSGYIKTSERIDFSLESDNEVLYLDITNDPIITIPDTYSDSKMPKQIVLIIIESVFIIWLFQRKKIIKY